MGKQLKKHHNGSALRLAAWPMALALALPLKVSAVGLGEIELLSSYAQPFSARVPVSVTPADQVVQASDLQVRLLPSSAYAGMGLSEPPLSTRAVDVSVVGSDQTYWIELASTQRVREPMMTLLLELRYGGTRVIRELPVLFDLPADRLAPTAPAVPTAVAAAPAVESAILEEAIATQAAPEAPAMPAPQRVAAEKPVRASAGRARRERKPAVTKIQAAPSPRTEAPLPRFQLAESFASYRALAQSGNPPAPATLAEPAVEAAVEATPAVATTPAQVVPVVVPPASPVVSETQEGKGTWIWALLALLGLVGAGIWRQRNKGRDPGSQPTALTLALKDAPVANNPPPASQPQPVAVKPADEQATVAVPSIPTSAAGVELKKRLTLLQARNGSNVDVLRKAQLVEAYIDLQRFDSADLLLKELEGDGENASRPKISLIKG